MNSANDQKPPINPAGQDQYFPPPPPGPPPGHAQPQPTNLSNEPLAPKYEIPTYDPAHPHYAPPPKSDDLYDATPTDEHPPPFPPRPTSSGNPDDEAPKAGWSQKLAGWGTKAAAPFNALANKMGSETFLPTSLDKECEKAARILRSFCKDGIYSDATPQPGSAQNAVPAPVPLSPTGDGAVTDKPTETAKQKKPKVLLAIPSKVISRAQGLAIFTTARAGFQFSGATGSGILIARLPDGTWSPPSGIQVHSVGAGFVIGLDIYDCVVVINTREALQAFTRTRMSLGSDLAVTAGPWGAGGAVDFGMSQSQKGGQKGKEKAETHPDPAANLAPPVTEQQPQPHVAPGTEDGSNPAAPALPPRKPSPFREAIKNPVYSYVKSRGFYAGVQIDGTVVTERKDANAAFYGLPISVDKIIKGEVPTQGPATMWPSGAKTLFDVLKGAEGWRGQQSQGQSLHHNQAYSSGPFAPPSAAPHVAAPIPAASGIPPVTAGVQGLHVGDDVAGSSSAFDGGPAPPPAFTTSTADAKAAEAAAEAAATHEANRYSVSPPSYAEPTGPTEELPPAYVEDGQYRPPADSKTGQH